MFFQKTTKKILSFVMAATMVAGVGAMNLGAISVNAATSSVSATTTPKVTIINDTTSIRHFVRLGEETKIAIPTLRLRLGVLGSDNLGSCRLSQILPDARHKKSFEFIKLVYDKTQKQYYLDFKAKAITPESKPVLVQIQYLTADQKQQLVARYYIDVVKNIYKVNHASVTTCSMEKGTRMAIKSANNNIITIKKVVSKNKNVVTYQKVNGQYVLKALKIGTAKVVITYNNTTYPNRPFTKELTIKVTKPIIG